MEEVALLRQLINQLHDHHHYHHHQHHHHRLNHHHRWCPINIFDSSADDLYDVVMRTADYKSYKMVEPYTPLSKKPRKENKAKLLGTAVSNTLMDQNIWKEFPEDLFEAVVARLPVATLFQFRVVCKKWNSFVNLESFSQHYAQVPVADAWFYTISHENVNSGYIYDPSLKKWHHPAFTSLPTKSILFPVASAGGLVCFHDIGLRKFYVCNPLTQSCKELPARSVRVWSRIVVGMILKGDAASGGYQILWVGCDGEYEVYDSVKTSWTQRGFTPSNIKLPLSLNFRSPAVCIDRTFYFMRYDPEGIVSYDMVSGDWKQHVIPTPQYMSDCSLAECQKQIMLVGLLKKNAATCVCIWELQKMTLLWKEVDRMPNEWCLEFYGKHVSMTCLGNRGLLMLCLRSRLMNRLVTYNARSREWLKVPSSLVPKGRRRQWIASGTAFHPCPTAVP